MTPTDLTLKPTLYILMRTDLKTMNPGKGMAQACHAANQFVFENQWTPARTPPAGFEQWQRSTPQGFGVTIPQGFGVTIVLGVSEREMRSVVDFAKLAGFPAGITHDPSYPIADGFTAPVDTCAYVFGDMIALWPLLSRYPLHP